MIHLIPLCIAFTNPVQPPSDSLPKYPAAAVISMINDLAKELEQGHPGYYRYHSGSSTHQYLDSLKSTITTDSLTEPDIYRKLKPFIARIGCLHTALSLPDAYVSHLNQQPNLLPLQVMFENNQAIVTANYSGQPEPAPGTVLTAINGKSTLSILDKILPAIPSDGYNLTLKYKALYHQFPLWYRSMISPDTTFILTTADNKTITLKGTRFIDIAHGGFLQEPTYTRTLDFRINGNIAILTIHSFAASDIKKSGQHFSRFIDSAFLQLRQQGIRQLIIDLRGNTGGTDGNAVYFTRHFFENPFRYWERITVTPAIARQIKGIARLFYRKPVLVNGEYQWQRSKITREFNYYATQQPATNTYTGKTFVLIDGFCMSSCADATAVLSAHRKAVFIGEETGGGYQGNNSGMMPAVKLRPTRMMLTVPLQRYVTAVDSTVNKGHGTMPDYVVPLTAKAAIEKKDQPMELALRLAGAQ
ncbi:S41 family peptidase [Chitinophaga flava]|nr:S41 family peptidase [Chitinophaga flava]